MYVLWENQNLLLIVNESIISNRLFGSLLCRQMFSSYPTTTLVPSRRAQTPPVSSLPTSPSDEVGRRQSLTSPDSQANRPQNRSGTCKRVELSAMLVQRSVDNNNSGVSGCIDHDCYSMQRCQTPAAVCPRLPLLQPLPCHCWRWASPCGRSPRLWKPQVSLSPLAQIDG